MDREIAPEIRQRRIVRRVITIVIALAALAFFFAATIEWLRPSIRRRDVRTAPVERGAVEATLQASGTVVPLIEQVVSSPVEARVVRIGRRAGDRVRAGDALLTLDTAASRLDAERLGERVQQKESETAQLRLRLDESIAQTQAQLEQKRLDAEIFRYSAQQKAKLREQGLIAESDALAANAIAKKSDIEIRQLEEALDRAKRSRAAQLDASSNDLRIARREHEESRRQLDLAMLRAGRDGVLTSIVGEEGATVRRGDILARIADLSAYRVVATISDIHASRLAAGMRANVSLDDATRVAATISSVDPRIENGIVRFYLELDAPAHPRLRNNLRVDVSVVTGRKNGVLVVRRGVLGRTNTNYIFAIEGGNAVRRDVRFGLTGDDRIEIVEGVAEGEEVVISDMTDYSDLKQVRIK